jgi:group I intron endonuclease
MAVIYQITNMVNGKYYIGSAEIYERRVWQHRTDLKRDVHKNPRLQASWNKYGADAFVFEILEHIPPDKTAFDVENTYLHVHVGRPECYNINTNAIGMRTGIPHTQASKDQLSANRKGKHAGTDHYRYGQKVSAEVREKIGAAQRGKTKAAGREVSEVGKAKIRANIEAGRSHKHWVGRTHTEEAKAKMSKRIIEITSNTVFPSLSAALKHYGFKMPTLRRALQTEQPLVKGPHAGLQFKYLELTLDQMQNMLAPPTAT